MTSAQDIYFKQFQGVITYTADQTKLADAPADIKVVYLDGIIQNLLDVMMIVHNARMIAPNHGFCESAKYFSTPKIAGKLYSAIARSFTKSPCTKQLLDKPTIEFVHQISLNSVTNIGTRIIITSDYNGQYFRDVSRQNDQQVSMILTDPDCTPNMVSARFICEPGKFNVNVCLC